MTLILPICSLVKPASPVSAPSPVYVGNAKIAALGLRIKHGCSYHGVSLNVDMDLAPYAAINPCGYEGMAVTQLSAYLPQWRGAEQTAIVGKALAAQLARQLDTNYT